MSFFVHIRCKHETNLYFRQQQLGKEKLFSITTVQIPLFSLRGDAIWPSKHIHHFRQQIVYFNQKTRHQRRAQAPVQVRQECVRTRGHHQCRRPQQSGNVPLWSWGSRSVNHANKSRWSFVNNSCYLIFISLCTCVHACVRVCWHTSRSA